MFTREHTHTFFPEREGGGERNLVLGVITAEITDE